MEAPLLDSEFMQYWLKLNNPEKKSLLTLARHFVELKEGNVASLEQYNTEIDEAMSQMDKGEFMTHEQVVKISKSRLNGK